MTKFISLFFLALSAAISAETVRNSTIYNPENFLNLTLNNRGYELSPMPLVTEPYIKHLNTVNIPEDKVLRILEIGGAYGKLLRKTFSSVNDKIIKRIIYDFCELDEGHVTIAKKIFEKNFPLRKDQVNYSVGDALDFLNKTAFTYDIILVCNVIHFLSPTQLLDMIQGMKNRLHENGKIFGMAMTPYYNFKKEQTKFFRPGMPCPTVPGEEINRQTFQKLRTMGCLFPGFPGIDSPSLGFNKKSPCDYNLLDKVNLSLILEEFGFKFDVSEFSIEDQSYYCSGHRWVSFILFKGEEKKSSKILEFYKKAEIEEKLNVSLFKKVPSSIDGNTYVLWVDYLKSIGVKGLSNLSTSS